MLSLSHCLAIAMLTALAALYAYHRIERWRDRRDDERLRRAFKAAHRHGLIKHQGNAK